ncbi:MAG: hypothetical protein A2X77_02650 [Gammaproteobacteria bacterium GWE2_42_36]|nr:MAG: hypothetical protein A2X77_02650 [Gammaproteobacteria bacterium GWE2_42_36]HCU05530.1 hypothetical protein [Coxiellaceae bacterium]
MEIKISAAILAGGKTQRIHGIHKGELKLPNGEPVIRKLIHAIRQADIHDIIVISDFEEIYRKYHIEVVADQRKQAGPLGSIETALSHFQQKTEATLILPYDMPNLSTEDMVHLKQSFLEDPASLVYAQVEEQQHPLFAIIPNNLLPKVSAFIEKGERKASTVWRTLNGRKLLFKSERAFLSINTPADLDEWLKDAG